MVVGESKVKYCQLMADAVHFPSLCTYNFPNQKVWDNYDDDVQSCGNWKIMFFAQL